MAKHTINSNKGRKKSSYEALFRNNSVILDDAYLTRVRPQAVVDLKTNTVIAFLIFAVTLTIYWITQNRSVTFWDVGEYIACSSIFGVPHPPGNPFYIILGRFATIIGFGQAHALVINSISGLMSALAVMFTYLFTVKLVTMFDGDKKTVILIAIIAALYNAFSFTFWNNAVEASVYPGRDLIINIAIWLTLVWVEKSREFSHQNILLLIVYILFLGFSIHQTALQIIPAVLLLAIYPMLLANIKTTTFWLRFALYLGLGLIVYFTFIKVGDNLHIPDMGKIVTGIFFALITYFYFKDLVPTKAWLLGILFVFIALSPHIYIYIRSELRPFINEGHPHNIELFSDYVLRRQYGVTSFLQRRASFYYQMTHHFGRYLFWQFFHAPMISSWIKLPVFYIEQLARFLILFLGFSGIFYQIKRNKHSFFYLLSFFFMTSIAMAFVMNLSDAEVRERDYFFVSAYYLWGVWMAIGSVGLIKMFSKNKLTTLLLTALVLALPIVNFASQYFIHNRSKEFIALDYGINFLNSLEEDAIIFTNGDNDTFPLWYAQAVADPNAKEYLHMARDVSPSQEAVKAMLEARERKSKELTGIRQDVTVANLSLLNTPWYIRHLRDIEGVIFNFTEEEIDELKPMRVQQSSRFRVEHPNPERSFSITIPAGKVLLIKDISTMQIIRDNFANRPIYFAVTVADEIIFQDHLRNEGMVNRLVSTKEPDQINIDRLKKNVEEVYEYRSIFDESVYKDDNMQKLITNYGAAYMRISQYYHRREELSEAAYYLRKAIGFITQPERFYPGLVQLYLDADDYNDALEIIEKSLSLEPKTMNLYIQGAYIHLEQDNPVSAFALLERAINAKIISPDFIGYVYLIASEYDMYEEGIELLEKMKKYDEHSIIEDYIVQLRESAENK